MKTKGWWPSRYSMNVISNFRMCCFYIRILSARCNIQYQASYYSSWWFVIFILENVVGLNFGISRLIYTEGERSKESETWGFQSDYKLWQSMKFWSHTFIWGETRRGEFNPLIIFPHICLYLPSLAVGWGGLCISRGVNNKCNSFTKNTKYWSKILGYFMAFNFL